MCDYANLATMRVWDANDGAFLDWQVGNDCVKN